ncbi:CaiB/BaiF CoA-transferase family protein [Thalassotalea nanhaiensis]|uniref:CaiB/BaiF CoA-transferase family protein n=1 Tax=Thalassotalea nanhaiensis TaxID=3065648 RepID=A0ABY9TEI3_9GAMM|nr:CaiB/BaiF CoA-transferase family protein [Colwelliaceae bacterium SQ345]
MAGPLSQLKVLDLSTLLPGPYATMMLADMGAQVLRIEALGRYDLVNGFEPKLNQHSYAFLNLNRNKEVIALDLKQQAAVNVVKKLIGEYDVIVEQFRPGVMAKFGLDYESLKAINPKLIYCSITGYGQTGCLKDRAGHDINYLSLSGLASFSGTKATGPVLSGTQIADIAGGSHHAVMGIMAAVIERGISGAGQHLDISMTDAAFALTGMFGAGAVAVDVDPSLGGNTLNGGHFYGYYQTADNRYISVGSLEPKFAEMFFNALGQNDWLVRGFSTDEQEQLALRDDISVRIIEHSLAYWLETFTALDACVEPVLTVSEAAKSDLMRDRGMVTEVKAMTGDIVKQVAPAIKFASSADNTMFVNQTSPSFTEKLLTHFDYTQDEIVQLQQNKAIK